MNYCVILAAVGNPDHYQYPGPLPGVPWCEFWVPHLLAARNACLSYIEQYDLGGGNWSGGQVYDARGLLVAQISYNGKVWQPGPWPQEEIQLTQERTLLDWEILAE